MFDRMTYRLTQIVVPTTAGFLLGLVTSWALRRGRPIDDRSGTAQPLVAAEDRIQELEATLVFLRDEKDTEFGRLETGAIQAMESTIARSTNRVADLESQLADALAELRKHQDELLTQRRRHEQLQGVLRQRDQRIVELRSTEDPAR